MKRNERKNCTRTEVRMSCCELELEHGHEIELGVELDLDSTSREISCP